MNLSSEQVARILALLGAVARGSNAKELGEVATILGSDLNSAVAIAAARLAKGAPQGDAATLLGLAEKHLELAQQFPSHYEHHLAKARGYKDAAAKILSAEGIFQKASPDDDEVLRFEAYAARAREAAVAASQRSDYATMNAELRKVQEWSARAQMRRRKVDRGRNSLGTLRAHVLLEQAKLEVAKAMKDGPVSSAPSLGNEGAMEMMTRRLQGPPVGHEWKGIKGPVKRPDPNDEEVN